MFSLPKRILGLFFLLCFFLLGSLSEGVAGTEPIVSDTSDSDLICLLDSAGSGSGTGSASVRGPVNCSTNAAGETVPRANAATGMGGLRTNAGHYAIAPVDKWSICRYIDNGSTNDYFVPFKTGVEWIGFLNNLPSRVSVNPCARPYDSDPRSADDIAKGLVYGPTSARPDDGDTNADGSRAVLYAGVNFPYWRTGAQWTAPEHSFSYNCREDYAESYCPGGYTCDADCTTDLFGNTTCARHDACCRWGTQCGSRTHSWTETFGLTGTAQNSDTSSPSWVGSSARAAGSATRPCECLHRYHQDGETCVHDSQPGEEACPVTEPSSNPSVCTVPEPHNWTAYTITVANKTYQTLVTFQQWNSIVFVFDLTITNATDDCTKQNQMILRNNFIDYGNTTALGW